MRNPDASSQGHERPWDYAEHLLHAFSVQRNVESFAFLFLGDA
jgi:hypothetical protein